MFNVSLFLSDIPTWRKKEHIDGQSRTINNNIRAPSSAKVLNSFLKNKKIIILIFYYI